MGEASPCSDRETKATGKAWTKHRPGLIPASLAALSPVGHQMSPGGQIQWALQLTMVPAPTCQMQESLHGNKWSPAAWTLG